MIREEIIVRQTIKFDLMLISRDLISFYGSEGKKDTSLHKQMLENRITIYDDMYVVCIYLLIANSHGYLRNADGFCQFCLTQYVKNVD